MSILAAFVVPHPPMIVPAVGRGSEAQIEETTRGYEQVAEEIAALKPETIIITSPHSVIYADYFHISPGKGARGDFGSFRASQVKFDERYDYELAREIEQISSAQNFPAGTLGERDRKLDHGTMVPLWFIRNKYKEGKILRIGLSGLPLTDHYKLGIIIRKAVERTGRKVVLVASGDLSHKLQEYGPYGYAAEGPAYDSQIMDVLSRGAFGEMLEFDEAFCDKAAECGHRSFVIMAGSFDGLQVRTKCLSHQDVTGVGYGICTVYPLEENALDCSADQDNHNTKEDRRFLAAYLEKTRAQIQKKMDKSDAYVRLARKTIETYIRHREVILADSDLPSEMLTDRAGCFVSIHEHGRLRGCIGTILPVTDCIADEIIRNAISASTEDPRFDRIRQDELEWLDINVDVLGKPEDIKSKEELDVKRYGVIVTSGRKRGLLLPDLDGVDTVDQQVSIAMQKAGIRKGEKVSLQRFEVIRHI